MAPPGGCRATALKTHDGGNRRSANEAGALLPTGRYRAMGAGHADRAENDYACQHGERLCHGRGRRGKQQQLDAPMGGNKIGLNVMRPTAIHSRAEQAEKGATGSIKAFPPAGAKGAATNGAIGYRGFAYSVKFRPDKKRTACRGRSKMVQDARGRRGGQQPAQSSGSEISG